VATFTVTAVLDPMDRRIVQFTTGRAEPALAWSFDSARDGGGHLLRIPNPAHRYAGDGTYTVQVAAPNGDTGSVIVTIGPRQVTGVSPATGGVAGGTVVTITGIGLTGATGVQFGGVAGTAFSVVSDSEVIVTAPAHAAGVVDVTVLHPAGNVVKGGAFTYA